VNPVLCLCGVILYLFVGALPIHIAVIFYAIAGTALAFVSARAMNFAAAGITGVVGAVISGVFIEEVIPQVLAGVLSAPN